MFLMVTGVEIRLSMLTSIFPAQEQTGSHQLWQTHSGKITILFSVLFPLGMSQFPWSLIGKTINSRDELPLLSRSNLLNAFLFVGIGNFSRILDFSSFQLLHIIPASRLQLTQHSHFSVSASHPGATPRAQWGQYLSLAVSISSYLLLLHHPPPILLSASFHIRSNWYWLWTFEVLHCKG